LTGETGSNTIAEESHYWQHKNITRVITRIFGGTGPFTTVKEVHYWPAHKTSSR
jgi:hypothetical protein